MKDKSNEIINVVCSYFGITGEQIRANTRKGYIVLARQMAMYLIYENCRLMTHENIGDIFYRDRGCVYHAINKINDLKKVDKEMKEAYSELNYKINYKINYKDAKTA
jgi:chromosomal replication initiation ATPase DnaA